MYDKTRLLMLYACSPVHMGAGVSLGPVDLPIQRERASRYPMMQGSGIKGALRHAIGSSGGDAAPESALAPEAMSVLFGPSGGDERPSDHAGALAFGDGRLVLFPVRSLFGCYAYCTSRLALARLRRDLEWTGAKLAWNVPPPVREGESRHAGGSSVTGKSGGDGLSIVLEDFAYASTEDKDLSAAAGAIAEMAVGSEPALAFFRDKIEKDVVLLSDEDFAHFAQFATEVEPHVSIDSDTGTAKEGAFFYEEHLPADAVLYCVVGCGPGRSRASKDLGLATPGEVAKRFHEVLGASGGRRVQFGGDGTTGRGIFHVRLFGDGGGR